MTARKLKLFGAVASISMLGMALAGCGTEVASTPVHHTAAQEGSQPIYGGTLNLDVNGAFPHLDPAKAYDTLSYEAVTQMYNGLVTYKGATNTIIGSLASSWTISPDGKTYTFHLRNAKFWNGDPVNADSFIKEFERVLTPATQSGLSGFINPFIVGSAAYAAGHAKTLTGMTSLDGGKTLQIKLTTPDPVFLLVLAIPAFSAVDPAYVDKHSLDYFDYHPMGTGPFELASYKPNQQWILKKNPNYFIKGVPYLNEIDFTNNNSPQAVLEHFEQGSTDLIAWNQGGIPSADYLPLSENPKFSGDIYKQVQVSTLYIGLNSNVGPTKNLAVRRALEYAINKEQMVKVLNGRAIVANQVIPPSMPSGYEAKLPADATYSYNPALAKKLLAKAGYPHGFTTTIYTDNTNPDDVSEAEVVQQDFAQIGIKASVNQTTWGTFLNNNETGKQGIFLLAWLEDFPDPSDFLNTLFNSNQSPQNNSTMYSNKTVDKLLNEAAVMPNGPARFALYKQAQNIIMSQAAWIPYAYPLFTAAVQPWVKNYYANPNLVDDLQYIWMTKH